MNTSSFEQKMPSSISLSVKQRVLLLLLVCLIPSYLVQSLPFPHLYNLFSFVSIALHFLGPSSPKSRVHSTFILFLILIILHFLVSYPTSLPSQKLIRHILYSSTVGVALQVGILSALWLLFALVFTTVFLSIFVFTLSNHVSIYSTLSPSSFSPILSSILSTFDLHYSPETRKIVRDVSYEPKSISVLLVSLFVNDIVISLAVPLTAYFLIPSSESLLHALPHSSSQYSVPAIIILGAAGGFGVSFSRNILPRLYNPIVEVQSWKEVIRSIEDGTSWFLLGITSHLLMSVTIAGGTIGVNKISVFQAGGIIAGIRYFIAVLRSLRKHYQSRGKYGENLEIFELLIRDIVLLIFYMMCYGEIRYVLAKVGHIFPGS